MFRSDNMTLLNLKAFLLGIGTMHNEYKFTFGGVNLNKGFELTEFKHK